MVPAGVPGAHPFAFKGLRNRCLAHSRQGVELGKDADHRAPGAPLGDESGRHSGDAGVHGETARGELLLKEPGASLFLIANLRPVPDTERHFLEVGALGVQELRDDGVGVSVLGDGRRGEQERGEQQGERHTGNSHHGGTSTDGERR